MQKDFDTWNEEKKSINSLDPAGIYFGNGDMWWCRIGVNVGDEEDGKGALFERPILVVRKFNPLLFWAIPLSTKMKKNPYYIHCISATGEMRSAIISQIRLMSIKRLTDKIGSAETNSFLAVKKAIKDLL
jgi:mRNA interferase MazF